MFLLAIWNLLLFGDLFWWLLGGGSTVAALTLFVILVAIIAAMAKKKVDTDEDAFEKMAGIFENRLHWPEAADIFYKLGRFNLVGARQAVKSAWKQFGGEKIWALLTKITVKSIPAILGNTDHDGGQAQRIELATTIATALPGLMSAKDTAVIIDEAIEQEVLGLALDADAKAKMVITSQRLNAWGLDPFGSIIYAIGSENEAAVKVGIDAIFADTQSDDAMRAAIKSALPTIVSRFKANPDDIAWLRNLVAAT